MSLKHLIAQQQDKSIVKKLFVAIYGIELQQLSCGFGANTLKVQQFTSNYSTLNTLEQSVQHALTCVFEHTLVLSFSIGILHGVPLPQHVYNITGLVLQTKQLGPPPSIGLSQESKQLSGHAFCCRTSITFNISPMQFVFFSLHMYNSPFHLYSIYFMLFF